MGPCLWNGAKLQVAFSKLVWLAWPKQEHDERGRIWANPFRVETAERSGCGASPGMLARLSSDSQSPISILGVVLCQRVPGQVEAPRVKFPLFSSPLYPYIQAAPAQLPNFLFPRFAAQSIFLPYLPISQVSDISALKASILFFYIYRTYHSPPLRFKSGDWRPLLKRFPYLHLYHTFALEAIVTFGLGIGSSYPNKQNPLRQSQYRVLSLFLLFDRPSAK